MTIRTTTRFEGGLITVEGEDYAEHRALYIAFFGESAYLRVESGARIRATFNASPEEGEAGNDGSRPASPVIVEGVGNGGSQERPLTGDIEATTAPSTPLQLVAPVVDQRPGIAPPCKKCNSAKEYVETEGKDGKKRGAWKCANCVVEEVKAGVNEPGARTPAQMHAAKRLGISLDYMSREEAANAIKEAKEKQ